VFDFLSAARKLVFEHGISVVPVIPAAKSPGVWANNAWRPMPGWDVYKRRFPTEEELTLWASWPHPGIGVITGELSGLIGVDLDNRPDLHAVITSLLPTTPSKKVGEKGLTHFFRRTAEGYKAWSIGKERVVDLLSERLCIIPPSVHPTGCEYEWVGESLIDLGKEKLPPLPGNFAYLMDGLFNAWDPQVLPPPPPTPPMAYSSTLSDVRDALTHISPDDYDTWIRVGMAIKSENAGADGFSVWDAWSQGSAKYKPQEMAKKWASFHGSGITVASLFQLAYAAGYQKKTPAPAAPQVTFSGSLREAISPQKTEEETQPAEVKSDLALPLDLLTSAPGLVGEIADWITQNNRYYQPSYSLAAALSLVGMIKGHNVCTEEDGRTNLLTISVGVSGSGKSQPNGLVQEIIGKAGLSAYLLGEPKSESGFLKSLQKSGGKGLLLWDEIGVAFKGLFSSYAPSYQTGIVRQFLKLYSMANQLVVGQEFADTDGKNPRIDLNQPCFCLYGTTTKEGIFGAFSSTEAVNGFAARLLIFETHDYLTPRKRQFQKTPLPEWLVGKVKATANAGVSVGTIIAPTTVPYSEAARAIMADAEEWFEARRVEAIKGHRAADISIWSRAYEQTTKVALTVEDESEIGEPSAAWAVRLVTELSKRMILAASEQIADNETHAEVNKVLGIIKSAGGWVSTTELFERTRGLSPQKRRDILSGLEEEEKIEKKEWATTGRKKLVYRAI
jgi:hypothetical protein